MPATRKFNHPRHFEEGMTLLEILITVVIVGILTACLALPSALGQTKKAEVLELQATVSLVVNKVNLERPLKVGLTAADLDVTPLGKHTEWNIHRVSEAHFCVTVWDGDATEGTGSKQDPLTFESFTGACQKVGVTGTLVNLV